MKKTLIALAAIAAAGAASAQSSVTLYGRLDVNVTHQSPGSASYVEIPSAKGDSVWKMNDGGDNGIGGSRWGMRISEDLGGGLKAYGVLESGFRVDSGASGDSARIFNRQAYVALGSSSLGDIRLGRQDTLTRQLDVGFADVTGEGEINVAEGITARAPSLSPRPLFQNFGNRVDNAVTYISPNFSGFQVTGLLAAGEGVTARQQGILVGYKGGPFAVGLAYEEYDGLGFGSYNKVLTVGGNWNFGFATIFGDYQQTTDFGGPTAPLKVGGRGVDHDAYAVGLLVPFGAAWQFRGAYISSTIKPAAAGNLKQDKWGLSARYALSKRTTAYGVFTQRGGDQDETFIRRQEVVVGVAHVF